MKKKLLFVLLSILLLPFMVNAKDLNLKIDNISMQEKSETVVEEENASINGYDINLNLSFTQLNDFITYKFDVINGDNEDYTIVLDSDDNYLTYELSTTDIKKNSTTPVVLKIKYAKEMPVSMIDKKVNGVVSINVVDKDNKVLNPKTGQSLLFLIVMIITLVLIVIAMKKNKKVLTIILIGIMIIPLSVLAKKSFIIVNNTYIVKDVSGLRYMGYKLDEAGLEYDFSKVTEYVNSLCDVDLVVEETQEPEKVGRDNDIDPSVVVERVYYRNGIVYLTYPNEEDNFGVSTSVSKEVDAETGDSRIIVGGCDSNPNFEIGKFTYNGKTATDVMMTRFIEDDVCAYLRDALMRSMDEECVERLFH